MFVQPQDLSLSSQRPLRPAAQLKSVHAPPSRLDKGPVRNGLLNTLSAEVLEELQPYLERVVLKRRQVLYERNLPIAHVYFIERGLASLLARSGDQSTLEVGTLGHMDFVGIPLVLGTARTPYRCVVQVPGEALRITAEDLRRVLSGIPSLHQLLLRYIQVRTVQSTQLVVCNTRHTLKQRLARWLLFAQDRTHGNELPLTHQFLGRALGVRRAGVTTAMGRMEETGLLHRGRGRIVILDRAGLESEACDCYRTLRAEHGRIVCDEIAAPPLVAFRQ
ncbi:Crp/Fnr family transcriptional regulator [Microvirga soli]|uniref:Crp/Fnr family transcriptional regulator n=1 Tax=Microvirga soli TaxID=1854496 RepID=UPI0035E431B8